MVVEQQTDDKTPGTRKEAQRTGALRFTLDFWPEIKKLDEIKFWWEEGQSLPQRKLGVDVGSTPASCKG